MGAALVSTSTMAYMSAAPMTTRMPPTRAHGMKWPYLLSMVPFRMLPKIMRNIMGRSRMPASRAVSFWMNWK